MTGRIFLKLIAAVLCILVVAVIAVDYLASRVAERTYEETLTLNLVSKGKLLSLMIQDKPSSARFREMARALGGRLTLIARDGTVTEDSEAEPSRMENHRTLSRPEVMAALEGRIGTFVRNSPTLGIPFLYVALPVESGALRLAVPIQEVHTAVNAIRRRMLASVAIAFFPAIVLAAFFARYVSARLGSIIDYAGKLADGRFQERLSNPGKDELGLLERKLNETGEKLEHTVEQLHKEHQELEKLERVRKDFVINVSHELRTPLASIQGYTETLLDGAIHDPANNVKFLSIIRQNAERLGRITADLLTLSRIELKSHNFQFASYYVNSLLMESLDSIRPIAQRKAINLVIDAAEHGTEVFCDSESVHQILTNLLDNAIKYTPLEGTITVAARTSPEFPNAIEISVSDTGTGIPNEDLPRLFERFYRVDKARSRELGGTGLGLAIVKHLTKAMGGETGVESTVDVGSRFWFTLPMRAAEIEAEMRQGQFTAS